MAAPVSPEVAGHVRQSALQRVFGALGDNEHYRSYWFGNQANTLVMQMRRPCVIDQAGFLPQLADDPRIEYVRVGRPVIRPDVSERTS